MMKAVLVCEKTGWTHEEYLDQPDWLVELFFKKWMIDGEKNEENLNKNKHGH